MRLKKKIILFILILSIFGAASVEAKNAFFYKEVNIIGGYSDKEKWVDKGPALISSIGFEDYRKFSSEYGDYMTTDVQLRVAYDSTENSNDAWGVEIHNAWLEYKIPYSQNFKFGHFDSAFGLEPVLDTHGTILQTLASRNIGFKKDWGFALKGPLSHFDHKTALQLGSGMSIRREDENFLFSSRISSPPTKSFQYGLSVLYGEVLNSEGMKTLPRNKLVSDNAISKKRIGLDGQYLFGSYSFKGETAFGKNDDEYVFGYLSEIDYTFPKYQNCQLQLQFQSWLNDLDRTGSNDTTITAGMSYTVTQNITLRAAFLHDFDRIDKEEESQVLAQFYYYGL